MEIRAAIVFETSGAFSIEPLEISDPKDHEVLVRIVGAGICHTDLAARDQHLPIPLPSVFGHEGAGVVEAVGAPPLAAPVVTEAPLSTKPAEQKVPPSSVAEVKETALQAPLPGVIIRYEVEVGDEVEAEDVVVILEAMKMANAISTPVSGRIKAINFKPGDSVERDAVLAIIS